MALYVFDLRLLISCEALLVVMAGVWLAGSALGRRPRSQPSSWIVQDQRSKQSSCDDGSEYPADDWPVAQTPAVAPTFVSVFICVCMLRVYIV